MHPAKRQVDEAVTQELVLARKRGTASPGGRARSRLEGQVGGPRNPGRLLSRRDWSPWRITSLHQDSHQPQDHSGTHESGQSSSAGRRSATLVLPGLTPPAAGGMRPIAARISATPMNTRNHAGIAGATRPAGVQPALDMSRHS